MEKVKELAKKWYGILEFPGESDERFYSLLEKTDGLYECDIKTRKHIHVWKRSVCHAHTNADRSLWVADQTPYEWAETPCRVIFYDRKTNKELDIFSALPYPNIDFRNSCYHTDPHPTFTDNGKYILSMTTVKNGQVDVAVTPVEPLIEQCRQNGTVVE